jgi:hypothetical protein
MDELIEIKDRAWELFRTIPGVHAVGIGAKVVRGVRTDDVAIAVFVARKVRPYQLGPDQLIPVSFEGVITDVVQMDQPRQLAGEPITALVTPLIPTGTGTVIKLEADIDPVPEGWIVVVTATTTGASPLFPPDSGTRRHYTFAVSNGVKTLAEITTELMAFPTRRIFTHSSIGPTTMSLRPEGGFTLEVQCRVLKVDAAPYERDYLRGGIRIEGHAFGTLGCLARTAPAAKHPSVVGITNQHVVSGTRAGIATLKVEINEESTEIHLSKEGPPLAPSIVVVRFHHQQGLFGLAIYPTGADSTLDDVAKGLVTAINDAKIPSFGAPPGGGGVLPNVKASQDPTNANHILVVGADNPDTFMIAAAFDARIDDPIATFSGFVQDIDADPATPLVIPFGKAIRFFGEQSANHQGVYVHVTPGGTSPTFGVFVDSANLTMADIAQKVSTAINTINVTAPGVIGPVFAIAKGDIVAIHKAEEVECLVHDSTLIGQPTNSFMWPFSDRIGYVVDARLDVDTAIIQLDPDLRFKPHIEGIGAVDGVLPANLLRAGLSVQMRGFMSGVTTGEVTAVGVNGLVLTGGRRSARFRRFYKGAIVVDSTMKDPQTDTFRPFVLPGDSGSALVTSGTAPVQMVGLVFGGGANTIALATPIHDVVDAFSELNLSFALPPGVDPDALQTVPQSD